ncbi:hypothetical protein [Microbacterium oleivorans]|uniref:hypothetical protein n=1 Tax=Microbacterium oleivorans TaxID=273677 RepID=UPI001C4A05F1|nr:hypothetical protein [Microbacterium oleivorans]
MDNYETLKATLIAAIRANDFGSAYTAWTRLHSTPDAPHAGAFVDWIIDHGSHAVTGGRA